MRLIVTGTPGTGKTRLSKGLARQLGVPLISANDAAKLVGRKNKQGEYEADPKRLEAELTRELKGLKGYILEGHLACETRVPADFVLVLRCNPDELEKRLKKRGYSKKKLKENVLAEALDYCLVQAEVSYGRQKVWQLDASKPLKAGKALAFIGKPRRVVVRWLPKINNRFLG